MTKPLTRPAWSTDQSNMDAPLPGQIATGWTPGQTGVSDYDNWFKFWTGQYLAWLESKLVTRTVTLHHSAFVGTDGTSPQGVHSQSGYFGNVGAVAKVYAPVDVPVGCKLTSVSMTYNVNGAGTVTPRLKRVDIATGTQTDVVAGVSDSTGVAIESQTLDPANHVVAAGYAYFIEFVLTSVNNRIYGATYTYSDDV